MSNLHPRIVQHAAMRALRPHAPLAGTKRTCTRWAFEALCVPSLAPRGDGNREVDSKAEVDGRE